LILNNRIEEISLKIKRSIEENQRFWVRSFNQERAITGEFENAVNLVEF